MSDAVAFSAQTEKYARFMSFTVGGVEYVNAVASVSADSLSEKPEGHVGPVNRSAYSIIQRSMLLESFLAIGCSMVRQFLLKILTSSKCVIHFIFENFKWPNFIWAITLSRMF